MWWEPYKQDRANNWLRQNKPETFQLIIVMKIAGGGLLPRPLRALHVQPSHR